jgi:hypothetical protein
MRTGIDTIEITINNKKEHLKLDVLFLYYPSKKTHKSLLVEYLSLCDEFDKK